MITREVFMDIKVMHRNGLSIRRIARSTGMHRLTVKRHVESDSFPEYHRTKKRKSLLDPYVQLIEGYLDEDDYQATWIFDRLVRIGYPGGYGRVKDLVRHLKGGKRRMAFFRFMPEQAFRATGYWG